MKRRNILVIILIASILGWYYFTSTYVIFERTDYYASRYLLVGINNMRINGGSPTPEINVDTDVWITITQDYSSPDDTENEETKEIKQDTELPHSEEITQTGLRSLNTIPYKTEKEANVSNTTTQTTHPTTTHPTTTQPTTTHPTITQPTTTTESTTTTRPTTITQPTTTQPTTTILTTQPVLLNNTLSITVQHEDNFTNLHVEPVRGENHIIFLETKCVLNDSVQSNTSGFSMNPREACAVESSAKTNPDTKIYLLYSCSIVGRIEDSPEYVKKLFSYQNVKIWKFVITEYIKNTPMEQWGVLEKVKSSYWPLSHSSDILRYLTLWKYGGTYLDLDFVILKSLADLGSNYAGAQQEGYIASGALNFGTDQAGRSVADACIDDIKKNYNGHVWDQNGPAVVTRVLERKCGTTYVQNMTRSACAGFKVVPDETFYPIHYSIWPTIFEDSGIDSVAKYVNSSYGVHVWNKLSIERSVPVGSKQLYGLLAEQFCPGVYSNCGTVF